MSAGKQEMATTEGLGAARKPKPIPRAENVPLPCMGSQCLDLPNPLSKCSPFQSPVSLLGEGCEAKQAHACPAVGMQLDCIKISPKSGQKAKAKPLQGFLSLPRSPSRPGRPGSPGCPTMTEGKERPGAPGRPTGPWRPGKPAKNK